MLVRTLLVGLRSSSGARAQNGTGFRVENLDFHFLQKQEFPTEQLLREGSSSVDGNVVGMMTRNTMNLLITIMSREQLLCRSDSDDCDDNDADDDEENVC